ncbi:hypothetical protein BGZ65_007875 [Modicella reniformis]|uniref:Protein kinase domain-containing protein n=1 Tax=Modicella reniformis TaxID=1440133 RepID=A0A9P6MB34_9FUNG|nr:hypothetical protein BGZ65_007875 [Modicella reniformis]
MASHSNGQSKATVLETFISEFYIVQKVQVVNDVVEVLKELKPDEKNDAAYKRLKNEHDIYTIRLKGGNDRIVRMSRVNMYKHEHYDQQAYRLEMEFVGPTLEERLNDKRQPALEDSEKKKIILEIAEGLQYIHSKRVVHADINTSNILLRGNKYDVKIKGFGFSRIKTSSSAKDSDVCNLGMVIEKMYQDKTQMPPLIKKCYDMCQKSESAGNLVRAFK